METTTREVANAIFAFFVTEYEYKTCMLCGEKHHVMTMRRVGDEWICDRCNATSGVLYRNFQSAASMFGGVRL